VLRKTLPDEPNAKSKAIERLRILHPKLKKLSTIQKRLDGQAADGLPAWATAEVWKSEIENGGGQYVSTRPNEENYEHMARVILIPQNYEQLPSIERKRIVPICISALDRQVRPIPTEWFSKGVAPVRVHLVNIARHKLSDPWCVSELAEVTVHRLCDRYHTVVRPSPTRLVFKKAMWVAKEMRNGGWRQMRSHNFNLALDTLDEKVRENTLVDLNKYPDIFERQIMLDWFEDRLRIEGRTEIRRVYRLVRCGNTWQEVAERVGAP
jgi:hypothetical protein